MKIEVCKGSVGLALYVDGKHVAGARHNGRMETLLSAEVGSNPNASAGQGRAQPSPTLPQGERQ